ncbi:hypothetical protein JHK86_009945 [Glycine max]|nr:hypothetical protein JHK86_009945 [Glycine max]
MLKLVVSASPLRLQLSSRHSMSLNLPHSANSLEIEETNDNIDDNTDMEVNEPEINTTTQNTSSAKENGQRKRGREGDKRIGVAAKLFSQLDHIIQTFESSVSAQDPTSITACVAKLKDLPGLKRRSELFYKATKLMKKRANRITFVALEEPELQLGWIKSET